MGITVDQVDVTQVSKVWATQLRASNARLLRVIADIVDPAYRQFWADPVNKAAALGTDAVALFTFHASLNQVRAQILLSDGLPVDIPGVDPVTYQPAIPPEWTYEANPDGSITLTPVS